MCSIKEEVKKKKEFWNVIIPGNIFRAEFRKRLPSSVSHFFNLHLSRGSEMGFQVRSELLWDILSREPL